MIRNYRRPIFAILALLLLVGVGAASAGVRTHAKAQKTFRIVLSNNFVGNQWRIEMQNIAKAMAANNAPFKGKVKLDVIDAEGTPTAQIQSLNNIIATHPDAILLDSASPTALNPVVQKACTAGIVVVTFDQVANAPCAYKVSADNQALFEANAYWLAKTLKGKGNIAQDLGLPGAPVSAYSHKAAAKVFSKYPGMKIVASYEGGYAPGPSNQKMAAILSSGKKLDGIFGVAGVDGAVQAFLDAKAKLVPGVNFGDTSPHLLQLVDANKGKGLQFQFAENPPTLSGYALKVAWQVLNKQSPVVWGMNTGSDPKVLLLKVRVYNSNGIKVPGAQVLSYKVLLKAYGKLPGDTQLPLSIPESPVTPQQALGK